MSLDCILSTDLVVGLFGNEGKRQLSNWRVTHRFEKVDEGIKEKEPLEFLLRRLVRGFVFSTLNTVMI